MAPRQKFKPNNQRTIHIREPNNYRVFVYSESYLSLCHCPLTMAKCITDPTIASVCAILQRLSAPRTWQTVSRKIYGAYRVCQMCADVAQQAITPLVLNVLYYTIYILTRANCDGLLLLKTCHQMFPALSATQIFCLFRQTKFSSLHLNLRS